MGCLDEPLLFKHGKQTKVGCGDMAISMLMTHMWSIGRFIVVKWKRCANTLLSLFVRALFQ
jgi:hypothetical protein